MSRWRRPSFVNRRCAEAPSGRAGAEDEGLPLPHLPPADEGHGQEVGDRSVVGQSRGERAQELFGGAVKFTTAHYLTPKKRVINDKGLTPDIVVKMDAEECFRGDAWFHAVSCLSQVYLLTSRCSETEIWPGTASLPTAADPATALGDRSTFGAIRHTSFTR